jgi:hypothetical protein
MRKLPALLVLTAFAVSRAASAAGPVYQVNSSADVVDAQINGVCETALGNGVCTLRAAVMEANLGPNLDAEEVTIHIPADIYVLTRAVGTPDDHSNGDLNLIGKIRLVGVGWDLTMLDGNLADRVFYVGAGAEITLENLRVQRGRPPFKAGRTGHGGGIYNAGGNLTLLRCLVRANETLGGTNGDGGGIYSNGGSLTIVESMLRVHHPPGSSYGGAIRAFGTTTEISDSTLYSNSAGDGGAVFQTNGSLTVWNSTISGNAARSNGGAIVLIQSTGTLNNVTMTMNLADEDANGSGTGGGIHLGYSTAVLSNSVFDNRRRVALGSTFDDIVCPVEASASSNGFNVIGVESAPCVTGAFLQGSPLLNALAENGGTTVTQAPQPGSQVINAGNPSGCVTPLGAPLTTDQRGVKRPIGARCDLGAFEVEPIGDANGDGVVSVLDVFYVINFLFAGGPVPRGRANVDGAGSTTVTDVFYLINYLFAGGPAPV